MVVVVVLMVVATMFVVMLVMLFEVVVLVVMSVLLRCGCFYFLWRLMSYEKNEPILQSFWPHLRANKKKCHHECAFRCGVFRGVGGGGGSCGDGGKGGGGRCWRWW